MISVEVWKIFESFSAVRAEDFGVCDFFFAGFLETETFLNSSGCAHGISLLMLALLNVSYKLFFTGGANDL